MCTSVAPRGSVSPPLHRIPIPTREGSSLVGIMTQVVKKKDEHIQHALNHQYKGRINRAKEASMLSGDVTSCAFSCFQGATTLIKTSGAAATGLKVTGGVCGIIGGSLMLIEGFSVLYDAVKHYQSGHHEEGIKIAICGVLEMGIGILMILSSLSNLFPSDCGALACIDRNPYIYPSIWFTLIVIILGPRLKVERKIRKGEDAGSKLELDSLKNCLTNPQELRNFAKRKLNEFLPELEQQKSPSDLTKAISSLAEKFKEDIGTEAGQEFMKLLLLLLKYNQEEDVLSSEIREQTEKCQKAHSVYYNTLCIGILQYALYMASLPLGILAIFFVNATKILIAVSDFSIAAPLGIGLYNDLFKPFTRSYSLPVAKVEAHELEEEAHQLQT